MKVNNGRKERNSDKGRKPVKFVWANDVNNEMTNKIPSDVKERLQIVFESYDMNNDGVISFIDLRTCFAQRGKNVPDSEIRRWLAEKDTVGDGVVTKAEQMNLPLNELDAIFITHFHSDHYIDLPYLINRSWVLGRSKNLNVYGPEGLYNILASNYDFLELENKHRVDHHGSDLMNTKYAFGVSNEFKMKEDKIYLGKIKNYDRHKSYDDYVNKQIEKTTDPARIDKWKGAEWDKKVLGFERLFQRNNAYLNNKKKAIYI